MLDLKYINITLNRDPSDIRILSIEEAQKLWEVYKDSTKATGKTDKDLFPVAIYFKKSGNILDIALDLCPKEWEEDRYIMATRALDPHKEASYIPLHKLQRMKHNIYEELGMKIPNS